MAAGGMTLINPGTGQASKRITRVPNTPWHAPDSGKELSYLELQVHEITHQSINAAGGITAVQTKATGEKFLILMPDQISSEISHQWTDDYGGVGLRMLAFAKGAEHTVKDFLYGARDIAKNFNNAGTARDLFTPGYNIAGLQHRLDSPLIYHSTNRLVYQMTFELLAYMDTFEEVVAPIRRLMYLSSPEQTDKTYHINLPNVFAIKSQPDNGAYISIPIGVITTVQPTYYGPYIDGSPMKASVNLFITDMLPTWKHSFEHDKIPRVIQFKNEKNKQQDAGILSKVYNFITGH